MMQAANLAGATPRSRRKRGHDSLGISGHLSIQRLNATLFIAQIHAHLEKSGRKHRPKAKEQLFQAK
jgi:hypothetical protein